MLRKEALKAAKSLSSKIGSPCETAMRSHTCAELSDSVGKVSVCGWLVNRRKIGEHLVFFPVRDRYGVIQCSISRSTSPDLFDRIGSKLALFTSECVVKVTGVIQKRPCADINQNVPNGDIELIADDVQLLSKCEASLPTTTREKAAASNPDTRFRYRYLDMRRPLVLKYIQKRAEVSSLVRSYFEQQRFLEVETPVLFKSTPEGAREFLVPTRAKGLFYSLVQSPQQYKQLLMAGGIDRYYQIAKCFRDEDLSSDKQPEFTQIDMEMSFVQEEDVMGTVENLVKRIWSSVLDTTSLGDLPRMTYKDAIDKYGIDKPDIRFDIPIKRLHTDEKFVWEAVEIPPILGSKIAKKIMNIPKTLLNSNQSIVFSGTWDDSVLESRGVPCGKSVDLPMSGSRVVVSKRSIRYNDAMTISGYVIRQLINEDLIKKQCREGWGFVWITDFPLFKEAENGLESMHHPFTAPKPEFINSASGLIEGDPRDVIAQHYDLVLNGVELGGGSIRIHDLNLQKQVFGEILKLSDERLASFSHLLESLQYGFPPHGGMALGLDRIMTFICSSTKEDDGVSTRPEPLSIRDVIAFPKSSRGKDLMIGSPAGISLEQAECYHQQ